MNDKIDPQANPKTSTTPILEDAKRLLEQANIRPRIVKDRVFRLLAVLAASVVFGIITLIVIRLGLLQSENGKALAALVLLMAVVTSVAAVVGLFMLLWTAFVISYVRSIPQPYDIPEREILSETELAAASTRQLVDPATSSGQHSLTDAGLLPGTRRPFWSNAAAASIPALITGGLVLLCYFTFGQSAHPSVDWTIYLIGGLPLVLAIYTGLAFYRSNKEVHWASGRDRRYYKLTILLGNFDQAGAVFGGLLLSAAIGVLGVFSLHSNQYAKKVSSEYRDVSLAYTRDYLEKVAVQSIKEQRVTGEFIDPQPVQKDISVSTTKNKTEKKVVYTAKPKGLNDGFIAEVSADSGSLYLSADNSLGDVGTKGIETSFVVGTVKEVRDGAFVLTLSKPTDGQKEIEIKLTDLVSEPAIGSDVVVAMDFQQMEARRIEEINVTKEGAAGGGAMAMNRSPLLREAGAGRTMGAMRRVSWNPKVPR